MTSRSHNAYRPITVLQPEESQTLRGPNKQKTEKSGGIGRGGRSGAGSGGWPSEALRLRDGSSPGARLSLTNALLETFWWVNCSLFLRDFIMWRCASRRVHVRLKPLSIRSRLTRTRAQPRPLNVAHVCVVELVFLPLLLSADQHVANVVQALHFVPRPLCGRWTRSEGQQVF